MLRLIKLVLYTPSGVLLRTIVSPEHHHELSTPRSEQVWHITCCKQWNQARTKHESRFQCANLFKFEAKGWVSLNSIKVFYSLLEPTGSKSHSLEKSADELALASFFRASSNQSQNHMD
jgi:hypothetical protein